MTPPSQQAGPCRQTGLSRARRRRTCQLKLKGARRPRPLRPRRARRHGNRTDALTGPRELLRLNGRRLGPLRPGKKEAPNFRSKQHALSSNKIPLSCLSQASSSLYTTRLAPLNELGCSFVVGTHVPLATASMWLTVTWCAVEGQHIIC